MTYRSKPFRDLCRDRGCACCGAQDGTIVAAHRNRGKGMAFKASDAQTIALCRGCHADYDEGRWGNKDEADARWLDMYADYIDELLTQGELALTGKREPRLARSLPRVKPEWDPPRAA